MWKGLILMNLSRGSSYNATLVMSMDIDRLVVTDNPNIHEITQEGQR
jgi:hypothetical protein